MASSRRNGVSRRLVGVLMGSGLVLGASGCAPPTPARLVDQSNIGPTDIIDVVSTSVCPDTTWVSEVAQTFTAGRTGILDRVSLTVRPRTAASPPLSITIRLLRADGAPGEVVVGSGQYSGPGTALYDAEPVNVDLSAPAFVLSGFRYALVLGVPPVVDCPVSETYVWDVAGTDDLYASGRLWSRGNLYDRPDWVPDYGGANDLVFRTWVTG